MVSINTSSNGIALAALRRIDSDLATAQNRIATGYKVNSARDNASVWASVTKMRSDDTVASSVKSGISTAQAQIDAALSALDSVSDIFQQMNDIAVAAVTAGAGTAAQANEITALQNAAKAIINGAKVDGKNVLLAAAGNTLSVVLNVQNGATSADTTMTVTGADVLGTSGEFEATLVTAATSASLTSTYVTAIGTAITNLGDLAATLGAQSKGLDASLSFLDKLSDIRQSAIGGLVDADLEKESAKVSALQVKQQLAYQALSMSNNSAQNVLMLFR